MSKPNGGPAFPGKRLVQRPMGYEDRMHNYVEETYEGAVSLRDYYAARATEKDIEQHIHSCTDMLSREQAKYRYADAMIKAREL